MKKACFTMFKNEASILPAFLDQIKEFFDYCIFVNHNSTDKSEEIVRDFLKKHNNGELYHLKSIGYHQSEISTFFGRILFEKHKMDVVSFLDTDEFLPFENRAAYNVFLETHKNSDVISLNWVNLAPDNYNPEQSLFDKEFYFSEIGVLPKVQIYKSFWLKDQFFIVDTGAHGVRSNCENIKIVKLEDTYLYHIPIRSRAHFMTKMLNVQYAVQNTPDLIKNNQGAHNIYYINKFKNIMISDEILSEYSTQYANKKKSIITIKKKLNFNFPYIKSRPKENIENYIFDIACTYYPTIQNIQECDKKNNFILCNDNNIVIIETHNEDVIGDRFKIEMIGETKDFSFKSRLYRKLKKLVSTFMLFYVNYRIRDFAMLQSENKDQNVDNLKNLYDGDFYQNQIDGSYRSAIEFTKIISPIFVPESIVDVGCGKGTWLAAFKQIGVKYLTGLEGNWVSQSDMIEKSINFIEFNLNLPIRLEQKFDMAMSLEVAEHLEPNSAQTFVNSLVELSDVILFSAAYTKQGGVNHINEQPHTFWAELFLEKGYEVFDIFRPALWGNTNVDFWYQQNAFLYVKKNSVVSKNLHTLNIFPVSNILFLNCVHPVLFKIFYEKPTVQDLKNKYIPKKIMPYLRKIKTILMKS